MLSFLFGYDIFISYSRKDGYTYATALANKLSLRDWTCFLDSGGGSTPGSSTPLSSSTLLRALRRSELLIVVATPDAAQSAQVEEELSVFLQRRRGMVIPIVFGNESLHKARWASLVEGLVAIQDRDEALLTGTLSASTSAVLDRIDKALIYRNRTRRLIRTAWLAVFTISALLLIAASSLFYLLRSHVVTPNIIPPVKEFPTAAPAPSISVGLLVGLLLGGILVGLVVGVLGGARLVSKRNAIQTHHVSEAIQHTVEDFYSCFISYSHRDKTFVHRLLDILESVGVYCWLDEKQLLPGDDIYEQVEYGIRNVDKVLLCCSEGSLSSWWVDTELDLRRSPETTRPCSPKMTHPWIG
jgi:hypothetical protein